MAVTRKGSVRTYEKDSHYETRELAENISHSEQIRLISKIRLKNQMLHENATEE